MWVRSRVPALTVEHAPRQVSSVYFDSATYDSYRVSTAGVGQRLKLRLRWYGDTATPTETTLEQKHRLNYGGWKSRHPIEGLDMGRMSWAAIRSAIREQLPPVDEIRSGALRYAVLIASYRRHYLSTTDGLIRVTVDTDLRFFDQRNRPRPNFVFDSVRSDFAIVECKLDRSVDPRTLRIPGLLGLRWTRFSKYCFGLEALSGMASRRVSTG